MKIMLEDKDVDKIAEAVAAKMGDVLAKAGKAPPKAGTSGKGKAATKAENDDDFGDGDGDGEGEGDDFGDGDGDGDGEGEGEGEGDDPTLEDVRGALKRVSSKFNQTEAMKLLKAKGGVDALSKLKEAKFAAVITAAEAKVKGKK